MDTVSPQRNEAPGGARDSGPSWLSQVEAWSWRSKKQFFSNRGRWNHCFWVPIITLFPEAEAPTRGPGVRGTDNTTEPGWLSWPASQGPKLWPVHVCTLLSPTKQIPSPGQSLGVGVRSGHLTVDSGCPGEPRYSPVAGTHAPLL